MRVLLHSIQLTNFQAHASLKIAFAPGITTIRGATDAGKSSVLRALGWVAQNNLLGDEFLREGEKQVEVLLTVDHGKKLLDVLRSKGKKNLYALGDVEFAAFGVNVPPDIAKVLALSDINFQRQHDAPFWFAESAPEVSRQLNAVIDLSVIDTTLSAIGARVRQAVDRKHFIEERITAAQKSLDELRPQEQRITDFRNLQKKHEATETTEASGSKLEGLLSRINQNQARTLREKAENLEGCLALLLSKNRKSRAYHDLSSLLGAIQAAQTIQTPPDFTPVKTAHDSFLTANEKWEDLTTLLRTIGQAQTRVNEAGLEATKAEQRFHKETKDKKCPTCGQKT